MFTTSKLFFALLIIGAFLYIMNPETFSLLTKSASEKSGIPQDVIEKPFIDAANYSTDYLKKQSAGE